MNCSLEVSSMKVDLKDIPSAMLESDLESPSSAPWFVAKQGQTEVAFFRSEEDCEFFVWTRALHLYLRESDQKNAALAIKRLIEGMVE